MRSAVVRRICAEPERLAFEKRIAAANLGELVGESQKARLRFAARALKCFPGELLIRLAGHPDLRRAVIYGAASGLSTTHIPTSGEARCGETGGGQSSVEVAAA